MKDLNFIKPYRWGGEWVFDDPVKGLRAQQFLVGTPGIADRVLELRELRSAPRLTVVFADYEFHWPGYRLALEWARDNLVGHWYRLRGLDVLCPALLRYFDAPPRFIYCQVTAVRTPFSIFLPERNYRQRTSSAARLPQH